MRTHHNNQATYDHGDCATVAAVLSHLPPNLHSWWFSNCVLHDHLQHGGFRKLPLKLVEQSLRTSQSVGTIQRNKWKQTTYFLFSEPVPERNSQSTTNKGTTKKQMEEIAALFGCS